MDEKSNFWRNILIVSSAIFAYQFIYSRKKLKEIAKPDDNSKKRITYDEMTAFGVRG